MRAMLKHKILSLFGILYLILASNLSGADISNTVVADDSLVPIKAAPVIVWNREITRFRMGWGNYNTQERAEHAAARIAHLDEALLLEKITAKSAQIDGFTGYMFYVGGELLFGLATQDMTTEEAKNMEETAAKTVTRIKEVFDARLAQRRPDVILHGTAWIIAATLLTALFLFIINIGHRHIQNSIRQAKLNLPRVGGFDLNPIFRWFLSTIIRLPFWSFVGFCLFTWLTFTLSQFPYTRPLADGLHGWLLTFVYNILLSFTHALPGLLMVFIIFIGTRIVIRAMDAFFRGVEHGTILLHWMQPETAKATRRMASIMTWLFAITVAYPYIPGSSSDAFKGVSVFAGLLLTLGSAGMVNQVMSGLVVVYARMMRPGDIIKVGDVVGEVLELGFLSTKVRTSVGHEISMPNALLVGTSVSNYSRFKSDVGPVIHTTVTIGYDTPWRQVHALLKMAASRTDGVNHQETPLIIQTALSDWYVTYEIRCVIYAVEKRIIILSNLHAAIQDTFNEYGVQIMSPNFVAQPEKSVVVPKDSFYLSPAAPKPE